MNKGITSEKTRHAYFVGTNTQLINAINVRLNCLYNYDADLFVQESDRISDKLVDEIIAKDIFNNVYTLKLTITKLNEVPFGNVPLIGKIVWLFLDLLCYHRALNNLDKYVSGHQYSKLITFGFWGCGGDIIFYFSKKNPNLKIDIVEEGYANYTCSLNNYIYSGSSLSIKNSFYWFLRNKSIKSNTLKMLVKLFENVYLYKPESYIHNNSLNIIKMPQLSQDNESSDLMNLLADSKYYVPYVQKKVYYILDGWIEEDNDYSIICGLIDAISSKFGYDNIIVKEHPKNYINVHPVFPKENYSNKLYYDSSSFFFEAIIPIININDKIIVTLNSSISMYPKYMYDFEPTIIFTYKLYPKYYIANQYSLDGFSNNLRNVYNNKDKIFVPESLEEYMIILNKINGG